MPFSSSPRLIHLKAGGSSSSSATFSSSCFPPLFPGFWGFIVMLSSGESFMSLDNDDDDVDDDDDDDVDDDDDDDVDSVIVVEYFGECV